MNQWRGGRTIRFASVGSKGTQTAGTRRFTASPDLAFGPEAAEADHKGYAWIAAALFVVAFVAGACSLSSPASRTSSLGQAQRIRTNSSSSTTLAGPPSTTTTIDPGSLPQTSAEPSTGAPLSAEMQILWSALVSGSENQALPLFFPESAYITAKTGQIPNPAGDYSARLIAFFGLDVAAYHQLLVSGPDAPTLVGVDAAAGDAEWIGPGQCENDVGYWHLPGVRLVYQQGGTLRSFAVASLISWRGVWYVVHLGPNPRPANIGTVDQPASGPGVPGPPGGC